MKSPRGAAQPVHSTVNCRPPQLAAQPLSCVLFPPEPMTPGSLAPSPRLDKVCSGPWTPRDEWATPCEQGEVQGLPEWHCWLLCVLEDHRRQILTGIGQKMNACQNQAFVAAPASWNGAPACVADERQLADGAAQIGHADKEKAEEVRLSQEETPQVADQESAARNTQNSLLSLPSQLSTPTMVPSATIAAINRVNAIVRVTQTKKTQNLPFSNSDISAQEQISQGLSDHFRFKSRMSILEATIVACILGNTITMLVEGQWNGYEARVKLGLQEPDGSWSNASLWMFCFDHFFNAVFGLEFFCKVFVSKHRYFCDVMNICDCTIVLFTSVKLYVLDILSSQSGSGINFASFRLLRFARTVRVLRMLRVMRLFKDLRILVNTFFSSMQALMWSMIFLCIMIVIAAIFISFSLQDFILTDANGHDSRVWAVQHYGSSLLAIYTMFEITLAGNWPVHFRPLVENVSGWYSIFIFVYIGVVVFGLKSIITALFLKETLQVASQDAEQQAHDQAKKKQHYLSKLLRVFAAVDTRGTGTLTLKEFNRVCLNPEVTVLMKMLDLDVSNAEGLFSLLDTDMVGEIAFEDFLKGVMRLKGQARSLDMVAMMRAHDRMHATLNQVAAKIDDLHQDMGQ